MVAGFAGAGVMRREGKGVVGFAGREVGVLEAVFVGV